MQKTMELLEHWKQQPVQMVKLGLVKTHDELQPRDKRLVPFNKTTGYEAASTDHIDYLRGQLAAGRNAQLDPVLLLELDGKFYVVDGHHRRQAYLRERRREIPACVLKVPWRDAVKVSKIVNTTGLKLAMHKEQRREACWQSLVMAHIDGEQRPTFRALEALFGVSTTTIEKMVKRVEVLDPKDFAPAAVDPETGWPRWKHARGQGSGWRDLTAELSADQQQQRRVEALARRLGKWTEGADPEDLARAFRLLGLDEQSAESAARVLGTETDEEEDGGLPDTWEDSGGIEPDREMVFPFEVSVPAGVGPSGAQRM